MHSLPKISIVIPVYNVEKYLRQCLESVINQTLQDIEIICVDDGSTDNSLKILRDYASKDRRIKILTQRNKYAGIARNKGLRVAKGEYVHFLDSDDWIEKDTYEKAYKLLIESGADLIKFKAYSYNNETGEIGGRPYLDIRWVDEKCFGTCINILDNPEDTLKLPDSPWSGIYSVKFLKKHKIHFDNFICANDVGFFYRCAVNAKKIYLSSEKFVYYRENIKTSLISRRAEHFDCQVALYDVVKKETKDLPEEIKKIALEEIIHATFVWNNKCFQNYVISEKTEKHINKLMRKFLKNISEEDIAQKTQKYYKETSSKFAKEDKKLAETRKKIQKEFIANIFSVRNIGNHKVICVLGIKLKIRRKNSLNK